MNYLLLISSVVILLFISCSMTKLKEGLHDGSGKKHGGVDSEKTCKACMEGYKLADDRHSCGIIPIPNCYKRDGILCGYCDKGYKLTAAKNACIPTEFLNCAEQDKLVCKKCLPGYKLSYNKKLCLAVPIPRCEKQTDTNCTKCIKPYTVDEEGTCTECEKGYGYKKGWCRPVTTDIANCKHQRRDKCLVCNEGYTVKDGVCSKLVAKKELNEEAKLDEYVTIEKTCDAVVCPKGFSIKPQNTVCATERVLKSELNLFDGEQMDLDARIEEAKKRDEAREKDIEERKARAARDAERRKKALEAKAAIEAKALGEGALGRLLKGANKKSKPAESIIEGEITPTKASLIKTLAIDPDYKFEITITPTGKAAGWRNIIHNTIGGKDMCDDCRLPGLWFFSNTTRLHIRSGSIGTGNFGYDPPMELPLNQETNVTITVQGDEMKVEYSGAITHSKTVKIHENRASGAAKFYASDPWYEPALCKIKNARWTNLGGHEKATLAGNDMEQQAKEDFGADCQSLSDKYGTNHGYTWGTAGPPQRAWWIKHNCATRPVLGGEMDKAQGDSFGNTCQGMSDKYKTSHGVGWGTAPPQERGWWVNHQCKTRPTPAKDDMVMKYIYKGYFGPHCDGGPEAGSWGDDFTFFKTASLVKTEKTPKINIIPNSLQPVHSLMITGSMIPKESGTLTFNLESDDASYLIIEGKVIIDNGGLHGKLSKTGTFDGEKFKRYPFTIFMGECKGANNLTLTITGAGGVYYDSKAGSGANVPQNPKFDAERRAKYDADLAARRLRAGKPCNAQWCPVGSRIKVITPTPQYGWGRVRQNNIGTVASRGNPNRYTFPNQKDWQGVDREFVAEFFGNMGDYIEDIDNNRIKAAQSFKKIQNGSLL